MSTCDRLLIAMYDLAWIQAQIIRGRKVGLMGKDSQLLVDMIQDPREDLLKQPMNIWLAVVDEAGFNEKDGRILQLVWPESLLTLAAKGALRQFSEMEVYEYQTLTRKY
jgi:hypothetical protein